MHHDTFRSDHDRMDLPDERPRPSDFANAVPRGSILRSMEPVVAPVAPGPVDLGPDARRETAAMDDTMARRADVGDRDLGYGARDTGWSAGVPEPGRGVAGVAGTPIPRDEPYEPASARRIVDEPAADTGRPVRARAVTGIPDRHRFSVGATFLGWAVASFFSLVFTGLMLLALGAGAAQADDNGLTRGDLTTLSVAGFLGLLVAMFLAYLVGGYAAGRIAHWDGAKHGAGVPVWTILFGLLALLAGTALGPTVAGYLGPYVPDVDAGALTTYGVLGILAMLVADFAGAILGGILGARGDVRHESGVVERRRVTRGRPL